MKLTFLGAGGAMPAAKIKGKPHRSYSAILVEMGKDKLLFDIGPGTLTKLQQIGIDTRIYPTYLFITHYHLDHFQDLMSLLNERYLNHFHPNVQPKGALKIYGPIGLNKLIKNLFEIENVDGHAVEKLDLIKNNIIKTEEINRGTVEKTNHWQVSSIPIKHRGGFAYRLDVEKKSLVYSGDMEYDENIIKFAKNADLIILECNSPNKESSIGFHLFPEDIVKLAKLGNFKNIILTHLSFLCDGKEKQIIKYIESRSPAKVKIAYDFFQVEP